MIVLGLIVTIIILLYVTSREKYGTRILRGMFGPGNVIAGGIIPDMTYTYGPSFSLESCDLCASCVMCEKCPQCLITKA
jgi:hypothetical protein